MILAMPIRMTFWVQNAEVHVKIGKKKQHQLPAMKSSYFPSLSAGYLSSISTATVSTAQNALDAWWTWVCTNGMSTANSGDLGNHKS